VTGEEAGRAAGPAGEREAVVRAVLDYFEGWFEGDAGRMERALHPELVKRTLGGEEEAVEQLVGTTAAEMIEATARGVGRERLREAGGDPGIKIEVEDIYGPIASVTVRSALYREYVHVVRMNGGWRIVNTLWTRTERRR
jgi:hypothetical protein